MCGRFTQQRPASELAEIFGAEPLVDDPGRPLQRRSDRRGRWSSSSARSGARSTAYRWGLIPHWATEAKVGSRMFNARAETITASPAFRDAFVRKRCLVPVDSFYEWKREGTVRQPYRIVRRDGRPLALAGLWAGWKDPATGDRPAHVHDRHDHAERGDRRPARPDAGRPRGGCLGPLARPGDRRIRASCSACWCRPTRWTSTSTRSSGT